MSEEGGPLVVSDTPGLEFIPSDYTYCPDHDAVFLAFMNLLPRGTAWDNVETTTNRSSVIRQFMSAISLSWLHFEEAMCVSLDEWICKTSDEDLDMWALEYGVPDECDIYNQNLCAKVQASGTPSASYLNGLLEASGYSVEGRWLTGTDPEYPGAFSTFHVMVDPSTSAALTQRPILNFLLGEGVRLGDVGGNTIEDLTCMLERYVPAHCVVEVGVAGEFTPMALGSKLKAWWNADSTANGDVTNWLDTVSSYAAAGGGIFRPISEIRDDIRYVTFDGEDDYLRTPKINIHPSGDGVSEVFALFDYMIRGGGASLITAEIDALGIDFLAEPGERIAVKSGGVITKWALNDFVKTLSVSNKLVTDKSGRLSYAPHNTQQYSDNIASGALWSFAGTTAPTATFLRPTAANTNHGMGFNASPHVLNDVYTYSAIMEAGGYSKMAWHVNTVAQVFIAFDLATATMLETGGTQLLSSSITSLGDGRCYVTMTYLSVGGSYAPHYVTMLPDSWTAGTGIATPWLADGTKGINIYRQQENRGPFPTAYLRTTTVSVYGAAIEYDPLSHRPRGFLVEPAFTNSYLWSMQFDNAVWVKSNCTVTPNLSISPMGTVEMDKLVESVGVGPHELTYTITTGNSRLSLFVKAGERTQIMLQQMGAPISATGFDLSAGTMFTVAGITANASPIIANVGNGIWRISIMCASASSIKIVLLNGGTQLYTGDGTSGLYIWGAMGEVSSAPPTSYIPTFGAGATRAGDSFQILLTQIPALGAEYSVYHKFTTPVVPNTRYSLIMHDGTVNERVGFVNATTTTLQMQINDNNVAIMASTTAANAIAADKAVAIAARVRVNDSAFSVDGAAPIIDTSVPSLPTLTQIVFGTGTTGVTLQTFRITKLVIATSRGWDNTELQAKALAQFDEMYWEANDLTSWATGDDTNWEAEA